LSRQPGVYLFDIATLLSGLDGNGLDSRAEAITGTKLSAPAMLRVARSLAFQWIPAALFPRIKAIVLDLDNTLYSGVLGEDGLDVLLTDGHRRLQERLVNLHGEGMFLVLVSKNEPQDVDDLFRSRPDFPLQKAHFSRTFVDWTSKAAGVRQAAADLRIGVDSILLIDDNPGELVSVAAALPSIKTLHATPDASQTARALDLFPGLFSWSRSETDSLRISDLQAASERERLASTFAQPEDYLASLGVSIALQRNDRSQLARLTEISKKTNQFNLALQRLTDAQVARYIEEPGRSVIALSMRDRLSDSGNVGALFARIDGRVLVVEELCISCRALGREVEDPLILGALLAAQSQAEIDTIAFNVRVGPRNAPARAWLAKLVGKPIDRLESREQLAWSAPRMRARLSSCPVTIAYE
jgi:FkbH-like protein